MPQTLIEDVRELEAIAEEMDQFRKKQKEIESRVQKVLRDQVQDYHPGKSVRVGEYVLVEASYGTIGVKPLPSVPAEMEVA